MVRIVRVFSIAVMISAELCACGQGNITAGPTTNAAPPPTIGIHTDVPAELTYTPGPVLTATRAPTPDLPSGLLEDFFFGRTSCSLPCWNDLRVGVSTRHEVEQMYYEKFGLDGFLYPVPDIVMSPPPGYDVIAHEWFIDREDGSQYSFMIQTWINQDPGVLEELDLLWGQESGGKNMSLQRVIRELGAPAKALVSLERGGQGEGAGVALRAYVIYDNGIAFILNEYLPVVQVMTSGTLSPERARFCLAAPSSGVGIIGKPFTEQYESLSSLQKFKYREMNQFSSSESVFNTSIQELTRLAKEQENACIFADKF